MVVVTHAVTIIVKILGGRRERPRILITEGICCAYWESAKVVELNTID